MKKLFVFLMVAVSFLAQAQKKIQGTVYTEKKEPINGALIKIKNTPRTTYSNVVGEFSLVAPKGKSIIIVSYLGYETQEIVVEDQTEVSVFLAEKIENLKEVTVIGYGEVKKKDVTGSISSIKPTDDNVNQAVGLESLIQGRAAGVMVNSQGFDPGSPINVQIRGVNTLSSNSQPLYVVDGIIVNSANEGERDPLTAGSSYLAPQNGLQGINPRDIESIEILKDASATAIYGSRGSNGVILITTKKGKNGKAKFNYFVNTKVGNIARPIDVLSGNEYALYQNKSRELKGFAPIFTFDANGNILDTNNTILEATNWSDNIYETSVSYTHRLSVSGGADNNTYYMAIGHLLNDGITPRANVKQTDFNLNLNNKLTSKIKLGTKLAVTYATNSGSKGTENLGGSDSSLSRQIVSAAPFLNYAANYYGVGIPDVTAGTDGPNAWTKDYDDLSKEIRGLGGLNLEYTISNTFKYKTVIGVDYRKKERKIWYGTGLLRGALANGEAGLSILDRFRYNIDNTLMFNKKFNNNHNINGTVGFIIEDTNTKQIAYQATDFPLKDLRADGISNGQNFQRIEYRKLPESLVSYLGRFNYNLYNKFNFTATFRADGSSKFSKENRFSYFPAFAFAYQINRENFFKKFSKLSEAKLRLGWGMTGNQAINPYQTLSLYNSVLYSSADGSGVIGYVPEFLPNPTLKWESTTQYNAGLDLAFFDKRLSTTIDVYYKKTNDLLFQEAIPTSSGYGLMFSNKGALNNKGIEFSFNADIIKNDKFTWNVFGNISKYRNQIANLNLPPRTFGSQTFSAYLGNVVSAGNTFKTPANIFIEGQQAALFWGFQTNGIINTPEKLASAPTVFGQAPQLGDVLLIDQNGDHVINDSDKTIIGNPNPDFNYGFGTNVTYKDWSLNVFFNGVYGNDIVNGNLLREGYAVGNGNNIRKDTYNNAWSPDNTSGTSPRINYDLVDATGLTDRIVEDGSFLRLSTVTLGYKLPLKKDLAIDGVDFSLAANNLWLLTKYSGYDPEVNSFASDPLRKGIDWQSFPNQKSITFGVNVSF